MIQDNASDKVAMDKQLLLPGLDASENPTDLESGSLEDTEKDITWMPPLMETLARIPFFRSLGIAVVHLFVSVLLLSGVALFSPMAILLLTGWCMQSLMRTLARLPALGPLLWCLWKQTFERPVNWLCREDYRLGLLVGFCLLIYMPVSAYRNGVFHEKYFCPIPAPDLVVDNQVIDTWPKWFYMGTRTYMLEVFFNFVNNSVGLLSGFALNRYMPDNPKIRAPTRYAAYLCITFFDFFNWARTFRNDLSNITISLFQMLADLDFNLLRIFLILELRRMEQKKPPLSKYAVLSFFMYFKSAAARK